MTKKDYQMIADVIRKRHAQNDYTKFAIETTGIAIDFADILQADNPRFNRQLFFMACGITH